jgi:hypothetical protein
MYEFDSGARVTPIDDISKESESNNETKRSVKKSNRVNSEQSINENSKVHFSVLKNFDQLSEHRESVEAENIINY